MPALTWLSGQQVAQSTMPALTCYVAMAAVDATQVDDTGVITSAMFGGAIPLKTSQMAAVDAATHGWTHAALDATVMTTVWYVLQVTWSSDQVCELLLCKTLRHCWVRGEAAFRWHWGPLKLRDAVAFTWCWVEIAAVGQFSHRFLCGYKFRNNGICADCKSENLPVWRGNGDDYCEPCWRLFYYTVMPVNLTQPQSSTGITTGRQAVIDMEALCEEAA
jgi:hypothetical protein